MTDQPTSQLPQQGKKSLSSRLQTLEAPYSMLRKGSLTHGPGDMKGCQLPMKDLYGKFELKQK